jgi:type II secretory pathway component PulC
MRAPIPQMFSGLGAGLRRLAPVYSGPALVGSLLGLALLAQGGELALRVIHLTRSGRTPSRSDIENPGYSTDPAGGALTVQKLIHGHLFGQPPAAPSAEAAVAPAAGPLVLQGTLAADSSTAGLAIIGQNNVSHLLAVGARIGDLILRAVFPDRVLLERAGSMMALYLPHPGATGPPPAMAAIAEPEPSPGEVQALGPPAESHYISRGQMQWEPAFDPQAEMMIGYKISGAEGPLRRYGFRPGDIATDINGVGLDMVEDSTPMLQRLSRGDSTDTVTVLRNGKYIAIRMGGG